MENTLDQIVNEIIVLEVYPRSEIVIVVTVFESDGYFKLLGDFAVNIDSVNSTY